MQRSPRFSRFAALSATLCLSFSLAAAEVPKALRSKMAKVSSNVSTAETKLAMSRKYPPGSDGDQRAMDVAADRVGKAELELQGLPVDEAEVVALLARMKAVKATLADRRAAAGSAQQTAAADNELLEAGITDDLTTLEAVRAKLPEFRAYTGDNETIDGLADWANVEKAGLALVGKYSGKTATSPEAKKMVEAVRSLARDLAMARDTLRDYHTKFLPPKVEQYLKDAENQAAPGNAKSNINFFVLGLFGAQRARVFLDKFEIMAPWFPQTDATFVAAARARVAVVEARVAAAKELVAIKNVPPVDGYPGADKEALRKTIAQAWRTVNNNNFVPLKIVVSDTAWGRITGWTWESDRWQKYDYSRLGAMVFYQGSPTTAFGWGVMLIKDHLAGDAIRVKLDPAKNQPASWSQVYLLKAIK